MTTATTRQALVARYGVALPDELIEAWSDPEKLLDDETLVRVLARLAPLRRSTWQPVLREDDGTTATSRYGGAPWLEPSDAWPACPRCNRPMQLFLQLVCDELPAAAREVTGEGVVQLFYCAWADSMCALESEPFDPFANTVLARRIRPEAPSRLVEIPAFEPAPRMHRIVDWREQGDYPTTVDEIAQDGPSIPEEEADALLDAIDLNEPGDKLGGWPRWIQREASPACPKCDRPMRLVYQLGRSPLGIDFGGGATGWLTRCETHADVLTFHWQR